MSGPFLCFLLQSDAAALTPISSISSVDEVCAWAARAVGDGGVGLSAMNVEILRSQEIDGEILFKLTDTKLERSEWF